MKPLMKPTQHRNYFKFVKSWHGRKQEMFKTMLNLRLRIARDLCDLNHSLFTNERCPSYLYSQTVSFTYQFQSIVFHLATASSKNHSQMRLHQAIHQLDLYGNNLQRPQHFSYALDFQQLVTLRCIDCTSVAHPTTTFRHIPALYNNYHSKKRFL